MAGRYEEDILYESSATNSGGVYSHPAKQSAPDGGRWSAALFSQAKRRQGT